MDPRAAELWPPVSQLSCQTSDPSRKPMGSPIAVEDTRTGGEAGGGVAGGNGGGGCDGGGGGDGGAGGTLAHVQVVIERVLERGAPNRRRLPEESMQSHHRPVLQAAPEAPQLSPIARLSRRRLCIFFPGSGAVTPVKASTKSAVKPPRMVIYKSVAGEEEAPATRQELASVETSCD